MGTLRTESPSMLLDKSFPDLSSEDRRDSASSSCWKIEGRTLEIRVQVFSNATYECDTSALLK